MWEGRIGTRAIVIHCSATPPDADIGRSEIDLWHRKRGWLGVGYHFVVRRDGTIEPGRPHWSVGAHVRGHNTDTIAICYVGGVDERNKPEDNRTEEQKVSLRLIVAGLLHEYPGADVCGHRDFEGVAKACPSFEVARWWQASTNPGG